MTELLVAPRRRSRPSLAGCAGLVRGRRGAPRLAVAGPRRRRSPAGSPSRSWSFAGGPVTRRSAGSSRSTRWARYMLVIVVAGRGDRAGRRRPRYLAHEREPAPPAPRSAAATGRSCCGSPAGLAAVPLVDNLGLVWVAHRGDDDRVGAAGRASAGRRQAIEAAWKYLILGSVGIGFALLGHAARLRLVRAASWARRATRSPGRRLMSIAPAAGPGARPAGVHLRARRATAPRPASPRSTPGCPTRTARRRARSPRCCRARRWPSRSTRWPGSTWSRPGRSGPASRRRCWSRSACSAWPSRCRSSWPRATSSGCWPTRRSSTWGSRRWRSGSAGRWRSAAWRSTCWPTASTKATPLRGRRAARRGAAAAAGSARLAGSLARVRRSTAGRFVGGSLAARRAAAVGAVRGGARDPVRRRRGGLGAGRRRWRPCCSRSPWPAFLFHVVRVALGPARRPSARRAPRPGDPPRARPGCWRVPLVAVVVARALDAAPSRGARPGGRGPGRLAVAEP